MRRRTTPGVTQSTPHPTRIHTLLCKGMPHLGPTWRRCAGAEEYTALRVDSFGRRSATARPLWAIVPRGSNEKAQTTSSGGVARGFLPPCYLNPRLCIPPLRLPPIRPLNGVDGAREDEAHSSLRPAPTVKHKPPVLKILAASPNRNHYPPDRLPTAHFPSTAADPGRLSSPPTCSRPTCHIPTEKRASRATPEHTYIPPCGRGDSAARPPGVRAARPASAWWLSIANQAEWSVDVDMERAVGVEQAVEWTEVERECGCGVRDMSLLLTGILADASVKPKTQIESKRRPQIPSSAAFSTLASPPPTTSSFRHSCFPSRPLSRRVRDSVIAINIDDSFDSFMYASSALHRAVEEDFDGTPGGFGFSHDDAETAVGVGLVREAFPSAGCRA
ncbi:hypothetical protein MSAN_01681300 [Mycena sanguinolenta]|uniref:Uncharacterized protein n=1 Tax=Mycena sanguinolenta TaxID=230812 RepID=A0A8H6XYQ9_9AGAR|nr:hypothetical protein MSAN_01681300 [Mycena sanguinolenta]